MKRSLFAGIFLTAACAGSQSGPDADLFLAVDHDVDVPDHADRARAVRLGARPVLDPNGPAAQASSRASVELELFDDVVLTAAYDEVVSHGADAFTWVGHVEGEPESEVLLSYRGDQLAGVVRRADRSFVIQPIGDGEHLVLEVAADTLAELDQPNEPILDLWDTMWTGADAPGTDPVVDVMVVYSAPVETALGSQAAVEALAELTITQANKGMVDSGVSASFRLVAVEATSWDEKGFGWMSALTNLATDKDGVLDSVPGLRDKYGADVVTLLVAGDGKACGLGYLMSTARPAFAPAAYTVVDHRCATTNFSLAHEVGHNMGSHHDRDNAVGAPSYPFSYGKKVPAKGYRTIMSYSCGTKTCTRVNRWSNPDLSYLDAATGVAKTSEEAAHNASSLSLTAPVVAAFRSAVPETPVAEAAEILLPKDGATLGGASMTLVWEDAEADEYTVTVGSADGKDDLHHASAGTKTTASLTGLPVDGRKLHVTLWARFGEDYYTDKSVYDAYKAVDTVASITSPPPESTLKGSDITFTWSDAGADSYILRLGSGRWTSDLGAHSTTGTSVSVTGLPADGRTIFATLYTEHAGRWSSETVTYSAKAPIAGPPEPAQLLSPTEGDILSGKVFGFEWTRPSGATGYSLTLIDAGGEVLYNDTVAGTAARVSLEEAPTGPLKVQLGSRMDGHWFVREYSFEME